VFQELIQKYFVDNSHRVAVEMKPDAELEAQRLQEEEASLAGIKKGMSASQLEEILAAALSLREAQEAPDSPEARSTLPRLALEDIDPASKELPSELLASSRVKDATVLVHELETSGILYADVAFDYSAINEADLELLPLFTRMLMEAGTAKMDTTALSRKLGAHTGGVSLSTHNDLKSSGNKVVDSDDVVLYLVARGKAVAEKVPILFDLMSDILLTADFGNKNRAVEMLKESKVRKESAILSSGHSYGATRLGSRGSFLGHLNEVTGGLTSVRAAGPLLEEATRDWPSVQTRLERMRAAIVRKGCDAVVVNLTGNKELIESALPTVESFVASLPAGKQQKPKSILTKWSQSERLPRLNEAFTMPTQVNYVVMGGPILAQGSEVKGSYAVASRHLSTGYLWDQVRVVGGAYGGFARFSEATGRFVYMSYRDPNCINTIETYDGAADALSETELSSEDLLQAVIGTIGDLDGPLTADQKGYAALSQHLNGESADDRQKWRTSILNTKGQDFKDFAKHLGELRATGRIVVFGSQQAIDAANAKLPEDRRLLVEPALTGFTSKNE
jgi:Zn-dependent M16 (insulinase) family peptidase